jgi:hypothetical protein
LKFISIDRITGIIYPGLKSIIEIPTVSKPLNMNLSNPPKLPEKLIDDGYDF